MNDSKDLKYKTLRLALAMRGGVSLAVWIGGAVAELDLFRRACNSQGVDGVPQCAVENDEQRARATMYAELLSQTQFSNVEIDILAGASAGGLNAVLLGLAQSRGVVMDQKVHDTWIRDGGIWELLRKPGISGVNSILMGDDRLLTVIRTALKEIGELEPDPAVVADHVSVELAATLLDDQLKPDRDNAVGFSFARRPGGLTTNYSTIPGPGDAAQAVTEALERMTLAARSTSSFPGAFEPATVYSYQEGQQSPETNMSRCFPYARGTTGDGVDDEAFDVVDGGIFDNIPIDRAIRAIQRSPASQPTERRLVYLDPEPPKGRQLDLDPTATRAERKSAASWIPVIRKSMALKQRSERAGDELTLLRTHNEAVLGLDGRLEAFAAVLNAVPGSSPQVDAPRYFEYRSRVDAERFARVLAEPWSELCRPPRVSVDYGVLEPDELLQLQPKVAEAYRNVTNGQELERDAYAMLDASKVLMAWAHALEGLVAPHAVLPRVRDVDSALRERKRSLYRCIAVVNEARLRTVDKELAIEPSVGVVNPQSRWGTELNINGYWLQNRLITSRQRQLELTVPARLLASVNTGESAEFYAQLDRWAKSDSVATASIVSGGENEFRTAMWNTLEGLRVAIRDLAAAASGVILPDLAADTPSGQAWTESVFPHLCTGGELDVEIVELGKIFAVTGIPSMSSFIAYSEITSSQKPTINVDQLIEAARVKYLGQWLKKPPPEAAMKKVMCDESALMNADTKLAGNVLSRFGGFFKWTWRENDWQWGRLDAAAGIVKILKDADDDLRQVVDVGDPAADPVRVLQTSILSESELSRPGEDPSPQIVTTVGGDTLAAISHRYRFALASRAFPLVARALVPSRESTLSVRGLVTWIGLTIAKIVSIPLLLMADPLRLAWALLTVLAAATLMGAGTSSVAVQSVFYGTIVVLGVLMILRAIVAERRWRRLRATLSELTTGKSGPWTALAMNADQPSVRRVSLGIGTALAVVAAYLLAVLHLKFLPNPDISTSAETFVVAIGAILGGQHWLNQRAYRLRASSLTPPDSGAGKFWGIGYRRWSSYLALLAAVAVAIAAHFLARGDEAIPWSSESVDNNLFIAAAAGAGLAALSVWGWVAHWWAALAIISCGLVAVLAQFLLDNVWAATKDWPVWDLLPAGVWIVVLGVVAGCLPARDRDFGEPPVPASAIADSVSAGPGLPEPDLTTPNADAGQSSDLSTRSAAVAP